MSRYRITRVGTEPMVVWDRDPESDLPRFTLMMPGWEFRCHGGLINFGAGASISATVEAVDDQPLVPSDPEPDIENGFILIGVIGDTGYTIADLRTIALTETRWRRFLRWWRG